MNYDFKTNWNDIILPLLNLSQVKKSIKQGINSYLSNFKNTNIKYINNSCPASYSSNDSWCQILTDFKDNLTEKLLISGYLKSDINEPKSDNYIDFDEYYNNENPLFLEYENYKNNILKPFIEHFEKTNIHAYQLRGGCHWWNPTFCLTLAKIIYPNEKWLIQSNLKHTTITNIDKSMVFDILYYDQNDTSFGGEKALSDSEPLSDSDSEPLSDSVTSRLVFARKQAIQRYREIYIEA